MYSPDKLLESEQSFRLIVDSVPRLVCTMTAGGEVEFVNQQILDYTGKTLEELKDWRPLVHPDDLGLVVTRWMRSIEAGDVYEVEHRILGANRIYRWFHVRGVPLRDTEGRVVRWYNLVTDIEDRKRAEEVVLTSEQRLRQIVDSTPGLIVLLTAEGEVEFVNRQGLEYFGKTLEELKSWATKDVVPPDDVPPALTAWRRSVETGDPYNCDHRLRRADGVYRWFNSRALPLRDANGRIVRWYNLLTDIDDRKSAEKKLRRSEECLLEAQRFSQTGRWRHDVASGAVTVSPQIHRIFGSSPDEDTSKAEFWFNRIHPEDRKGAQQVFERSESQKTDYQADYRTLPHVQPSHSGARLHAEVPPLRPGSAVQVPPMARQSAHPGGNRNPERLLHSSVSSVRGEAHRHHSTRVFGSHSRF